MCTVVTTELESILNEAMSSVIDREHNTLNRILEQSQRRVILFGAGGLGRRALACLRSVGVEPLAFCDNNQRLWGSQVDNLRVLSPALGAKEFGSEAVFIVTIWNTQHWYTETESQLRNLGCRHIIPPSPVYWRFAESFLPFFAQDRPRNTFERAADVMRAATIWADVESQQEYVRQIRWRTRGEWTFARPSSTESYFPEGMFNLIRDEVFVDCGAFNGDTLRTYLSKSNCEFRKFLALEPDAITFSDLTAYISKLPSETRGKIAPLHCAVGSERGNIRFEDSGGLGSHSCEGGSSVVSCVPISDLIDGSERVSFIKMDIEGAEYDALLGARPVIQRDRPVLAICVYHKQRDIWELPLFMKSMVSEYQMFLRCHEADGWQTVAYAVPVERLADGSQG
jgi:FkbM family methyltransferase